MSIDVMKLVWDKSQHKETNLVALLALADMANIDGFCWPSHDTLAKRCRCNRRNIVYIIEKLEASGELYVEHNRGRNRSNRYMITIDVSAAKLADLFVKYFDLPASEAVEEAKKHIEKCAIGVNNVQPTAHLDNVQSVAHFSKENVQSSVNNVQPDALKCATDCTRSVIEPSIEPKERVQTASPEAKQYNPSLSQIRHKSNERTKSAEHVKEAKALGMTPAQFTANTDALLEGFNKKALVDAGDDAPLHYTQEITLILARMSESFRTVEGINSIFESWKKNDYRGDTTPTSTQFKEHASLMVSGKVVCTRKTPTADATAAQVKPMVDFKQWLLNTYHVNNPKFIGVPEAVLNERYARYQQQQQQTH